LVDFHRLAIPLIIILAISGVVSFFLAHNFYPKKNVNVNVGGVCYELVGSAFNQYKDLEAQRSVRILQLQLNAIEPHNAALPISFSGTKDGVIEFSSKYDINITANNRIGNINEYVTNGIIKKSHLERILEDLEETKNNPLNRTVLSTVGLQPNLFITEEEGRQIAGNITRFMQTGIRQIIESGNTGDINTAECRSSTGPFDVPI
jgi:hypothetical protein